MVTNNLNRDAIIAPKMLEFCDRLLARSIPWLSIKKSNRIQYLIFSLVNMQQATYSEYK
jgi:hypothetical protein